eukprot:14385.XXX_252959_253213_1 [CDS] Oithona nana genome sequencing.
MSNVVFIIWRFKPFFVGFLTAQKSIISQTFSWIRWRNIAKFPHSVCLPFTVIFQFFDLFPPWIVNVCALLRIVTDKCWVSFEVS